jgi:adenosylhomocysteine nucleosidase
MASDQAAGEEGDEAGGEAAGEAANDGPIVGIVAAMEEEVTGMRARMVGGRPIAVNGREVHVTVGRLGGARVALAVTGDGPRHARRGLAALLAVQPPDRIIVVGVAGGLSATLDVGALVIGRQVIDEADGSVYQADAALVETAATSCGARRGVAVTATRIADTAAEKRRLLLLAAAIAPVAGDHGGPGTAAVVDLESAAFAAAATRAGIPWLVLRAVSDTAADAIPALLNRSRDAGGAVRRGSVMRGLLTNPGALLPLLELRERVRACAAPLAQAVERTLAGWRATAARAAGSPVVTRDHRPGAMAVQNGE